MTTGNVSPKFSACWISILLVVGGLGLPTFASEMAKETATMPEKQVIQMTLTKRPLRGGDNLGYGNCQWLYPFDEPQEKLLSRPKCKSDKPVFYAARFGDSKDHTFTLLIDESGGTGNGYDLLYVDSNNDNRIDEKEERYSFRMSTRILDNPIHVKFFITAGGNMAPHYYQFTAFHYPKKGDPVHANLRNGSYYSGEAVIAGKRRNIALADLDSNGLFNDVEKDLFEGERFFVDLSDIQPGRRSSNLDSFPYGKYTEIAGQWYSIAATPDGSRVEITPANPRFGTVVAPPHVSQVTLISPSQALTLDFTKGENRGIVGTYRVCNVTLRERTSEGTPVELKGGTLSSEGPEVTIAEGEESRLVAGYPVRVEIQSVPAEDDRTVELRLVLVGSGGEVYRWNKRANEPAPEPTFEIRDTTGKAILSTKFEYG